MKFYPITPLEKIRKTRFPLHEKPKEETVAKRDRLFFLYFNVSNNVSKNLAKDSRFRASSGE